MTSHELAKQLLEMPNKLVIIAEESTPDELSESNVLDINNPEFKNRTQGENWTDWREKQPKIDCIKITCISYFE